MVVILTDEIDDDQRGFAWMDSKYALSSYRPVTTTSMLRGRG